MAVSLKLPLVVVDDTDLVRVSEENPGYQFEREEDGTLTVSPTFSDGGAKSGKAYRHSIRTRILQEAERSTRAPDSRSAEVP